MSKKSNIGAALAGAAIGIGAGILLAPKSGEETRKDLKEKFDEVVEKVKSIKVEDVKKEINQKIKDLEKEIKSLDKERVLEIAQKKAEAIKIKADDLVDLAIKKGEMAFSKTAEELREKAIAVTKNVLEKLEDK